VLTADPITGTRSRIGQHSVEINANDIATTGARPKWYLCTILLPVGSKESLLKSIATEIHQTAKRLGITVVGGHTEATRGITHPMISGFMIGEAKGRVLTAGNGHLGDRILLTKTAGLEGAAILARDKRLLLERKGVSERILKIARQYQDQISIVDEALFAAKLKGVHALHDPTEGGILNGLWELAEASKLGVEVWADNIPVGSPTRTICSALKLDPLKLMSSGSLLLAVEESKAHNVLKTMSKVSGQITEIGRLKSRRTSRILIRHGRAQPLKCVSRDELYRVA